MGVTDITNSSWLDTCRSGARSKSWASLHIRFGVANAPTRLDGVLGCKFTVGFGIKCRISKLV
jgi:hypothetical protein